MKAFTLVETLVAITVLTIAIAGPMYSIRTALVTSYTARDKLIATQLAQEGIEVVRELRDSNYLSNYHDGTTRSWVFGVPAVCISTNPNSTSWCTVDISNSSGAVLATCGSNCQPLTISSNKIYTQDQTGTPTTFVRKLKLYQRTTDQMDVVVDVSWTTNTIPYSIQLTGTIYNWL